MATDVEESDTDDYERPAPPKRQCTRLVKEKHSAGKEETLQDAENIEYDDAERHATEKLNRWQVCQEAAGFVDNAINRVLDNLIMGLPSSYPSEDSRFHLFSGNDMENTAVMMAIHNHGLVQSLGLVAQSHALYSNKAPDYWTSNAYAHVHCSCPTNRVQGVGNFPSPRATTSTDSLRLNSLTEIEQYNQLDWDADKIDDSDQQEDFLERAVAEAIKKKGLSARSVDYG